MAICYFDSAPFTSNATGGGKKGLLEVMAPPATSFSSGGHDAYLLKYGDRVRLHSDCTSVTLRALCSGTPSISLYVDDVLISSQDATGTAGVATLTWSGLAATSKELIFVTDKVSDSGHQTYYHYVDPNGSGILDVGHTTTFIYQFGDSRAAQTTGGTIIEAGHTWPASLVADVFYGFNKNGSGQKVSTWGRDNTATIPTTVDQVVVALGINDCIAAAVSTTFQNDYKTMLDNIRTRIGAGKRIICYQPLPATDATVNAARATAGTAIQAAITATGDANTIYVSTGNSASTDWVTRSGTYMSDGVHNTAAGEVQQANREAPVIAATSISISGPSILTQGAVSSNFTVSIVSGATFTGDQAVTLTCSDAGATITPSVGSPGTGAVTVTPAAAATGFTFTVTPAVSGSGKTITPTSAQGGWTMPSALTYTANAYTITGVTALPATATLYGGATQQFTATVQGTNSPPQTVTWSVDNGGNISVGGLFTAPGGLASGAQTFTVTATSTGDSGYSDTSVVTVPAHTASGGSGGSCSNIFGIAV